MPEWWRLYEMYKELSSRLRAETHPTWMQAATGMRDAICPS